MASAPEENFEPVEAPEVSFDTGEISFDILIASIKNYYFRIQFDDEEAEIQHTTGRKRLFSKELRCMMYGFGDDQNPYTESVDLLEDLVIEFITETTHRAMEIGRTGRVQVEDIVFLVR